MERSSGCEVTSFDLQVIGHVPEDLTGRFLPIGANPIDDLDQMRLARHHWFAGAGMAHGLRLRGGKAEWFRSRFVLDRLEYKGDAVRGLGGRAMDVAAPAQSLDCRRRPQELQRLVRVGVARGE